MAAALSQDIKQSKVLITMSILITHLGVSASQHDILICHVHRMSGRYSYSIAQMSARRLQTEKFIADLPEQKMRE